jgi:phytoene dehydrogenase-like protein
MSDTSTLNVIVVGAGLAGLACAADLAAAGAAITVLEASDAVGGRMRTDRLHTGHRDGYLLDRGFQVFNTSYPQVQRRMDLRALQLSPFTPGRLLHTGAGRLRFADPTRRPAGQGDLVRGRLAGPGGLAALAGLSARDMLLPARLLTRAPDHSTLAALASARIPGELIERMFRPFLAGVFLEDQLETSGRFFHLVWRSMLRGTLCLPRRGIQAVPEQLAAGLPPGTGSGGTGSGGTGSGGTGSGSTGAGGPRRYVCGDYRATGSVQGALASGARAAREVLARA